MRNSNGNDALQSLFKTEKIFLDFIFENCFFLSPESAKLYNTNNKSIRNSKDLKYSNLYRRENEKFKKIRRTRNVKNNLKKYSKEDRLFFKDSESNFISVNIDSTGNASPRKFIKEIVGIDLLHKNYKISHLENKPNTLLKHGFWNIILTPTFIDHYFDKNIIVDNKNVNNVAKLIALKLYGLENYFRDFHPTQEEVDYTNNIKPKIIV